MVTCKSLGRLGRFANQMFQIAGVIGIATKNGHPFCFPKWVNYDHRDRFGSSEDIEVYKFFENELPEMVDIPYQYRWIDWGYHDVRLKDGAWDLAGHFQSDKYFSHCIDKVRHYFRMKDEYPPNDYVAIHYRAGDYTDDPNAYHPRCSREYYEKAMSLFSASTEFVVFTDDAEKAREVFFSVSQTLSFYHGDYIEDFKMMKSCKHFICANSSYSLMAAILADQPGKKIVCPKRWFGKEAPITFEGMYPENAIVL